MRVSHLMLVTLRDDPAEAEVISHKLLLRAGYIRRVTIGIYAYLPLLWRVLKKISSCVREEMTSAGAIELLMPQLQPADIWQLSKRWAGYTQGEGIMFNLKDRQGRELALGPTHEEVVTNLVDNLIKSYRQLPCTLYQIQTKFRDEIRPRFGLMRSREFVMKDAYSFHSSEIDLKVSYDRMDLGYRNIFRRCGLNVVAVEADSGSIGGAASQEFMVTAEAGEDLILISEDKSYAANQERAISLPKIAFISENRGCQYLSTPKQTSIDQLCQAHGLHSSQIVKVLLMLARFSNCTPIPILVSLRGDQNLNEVKLISAVKSHVSSKVGTLLEITPITPEGAINQGVNNIPFGYLGPQLDDKVLLGAKDWQKRFLRFVDPTAAALTYFVCGANIDNKHLIGASWGDLFILPSQVDLRAAQANDQCIHNPIYTLTENRGIEVGHIFRLGHKYSIALNANYTNEIGNQEPFWMGCYGIGISRLSQAAVEQHHDQKGICWPLSIAPFEVIIVIVSIQDEIQRTLGEALYSIMKAARVDVLIDDRQDRAGVKFKDADLIGIPWQIVIGRGAINNQIELVERITSRSEQLDAGYLVKYFLQYLERTHNIFLGD
uniref:proline--tRNA ligase n=1 Tax=Paulinella chromatophora TaxID=39717 RepID=B1X5S3_PAUCH|nr:prolyl-tRNA synthetase [Paulinella chromatophora]ACB43292.1 prolyl-tRNA synthetase [Paulinella chromatophora]